MIKPVVYTKIPEAPALLLAEAVQYPIADLHEGLGIHGGRNKQMFPSRRPITPGLRIVGSAITVYSYPGDTLMMHKAVHLAKAGQVLVLSNGGHAQGAMWGDLIAIHTQQKKLGGIIVDGNVRDSDTLREMRDPVWCTGIWAGHPGRSNVGAINIPIVCAGTLVNPGDVVAADGDGVLVIPRRHFAMAVEGARARKLKEVDIKRRLDAGEPLHAQEAIDAVLRDAGVEIRERMWCEDEAVAIAR